MKVDYSIKDVLISLFAGIACATLIGCANEAEKEIPPPREIDGLESMEYIVFDGHEYVKYRSGYGNCSVGGIAHSPKCPCQFQNQTKFH